MNVIIKNWKDFYLQFGFKDDRAGGLRGAMNMSKDLREAAEKENYPNHIFIGCSIKGEAIAIFERDAPQVSPDTVKYIYTGTAN